MTPGDLGHGAHLLVLPGRRGAGGLSLEGGLEAETGQVKGRAGWTRLITGSRLRVQAVSGD